ncbi:MAG: hypothetical protein RIB84_17010 [Sneathiellaceae bacterium]
MTMDRNDPPRLLHSLDAAPLPAEDEGTIEGGRVLDITRYRLTTAEILYHMPDHPKLLQTYVWQEMDIAPRFPVLYRFLDFWQRELEGKLNRVRVAHAGIVGPAGARFVDLQVGLH